MAGTPSESSKAAEELAAALEKFRTLLDPAMVDALQPCGPATVYTAWVTVWLLVYQRLHANATLESAVAELLKIIGGISSNKRVREQTLSANTSTYSLARSRLNVAVTDAVADHVFATIIAASPPSLVERRVFVIDGTTLALESNDRLRKHWPPGENQHGPGTWPICHLAVAHELASGAVVRPEVGAMYGPEAVSEVELAIRMLPRIPAKSLLMADQNFGVFNFAYAAVTAGHGVVTRLTRSRFQAMKRSAQLIAPGRWLLSWKPSHWERRAHPDLPADAEIQVHLHEFVGFSGKTMWIMTTLLDISVEVLAELYAKRWSVETDIRQLKRTLQCDRLRGRSPEMIMKELAMAMVSYNLVVQVRRIAAEGVHLPPRRLSFSGVWSLVTTILLSSNDWTADEWLERFEWVLRGAAQRKLPHRPGRSYPREILPRGNKFPKRRRKKVEKATK
jgi:hypothetical protein